MSEKEALKFETDEYFQNILDMRRFDEAAKQVDLKVPDFASYSD